MYSPQQRKRLLSSLLSALALGAGFPALAAHEGSHPLVVIDLPADPHVPAIATMTTAGHRYRMIVDTGAGDLFFHLPIAERDLVAADTEGERPSAGNGLHGDMALRHFKSGAYQVGDWTLQTRGEVLAVDLGRLASEYGVDGLLGAPYLSELSWHWDNRARRLSGYHYYDDTVSKIRAGLHCELLRDVNSLPGVMVSVGNEQTSFALDTGDLGASGNLHTQDIEALQARGAVAATAMLNGHTDVAGQSLPPLQLIQIQNLSLGPTRLDGLVMGEIDDYSRLGRGFLSKFNEVLFDFGSGTFCFPAVAGVAPDDLSSWQAP